MMQMVSKRNATIVMLVALFLLSSASYGDSRYQKDAIGNDKNISIFGHPGNIPSNGMKLENLNNPSIQNYIKTRPLE